jgi:hypothetical protein
VITVMVDTEGERMDMLLALRIELGGTTPFQVLVQGQLTDRYPSGWAGARG